MLPVPPYRQFFFYIFNTDQAPAYFRNYSIPWVIFSNTTAILILAAIPTISSKVYNKLIISNLKHIIVFYLFLAWHVPGYK